MFYIIFAVIAEIGGKILDNGINSTLWWFNIYTFFEFSSIFGFYYFLTKNKLSKKIIVLVSFIFYVIYTLSFIYIKLQNYTVVILPFFIVPFMFMYLKELLNSNRITDYKKEIPFWLTVGFLFYYIGTVPFFSLLYIGGMYNRILFTLLTIIVIVMNIIFMGGLLWSKSIQK